MFGIIGYGSFVISSILLNLTPGADTIYVLSRSAIGGRRVGVASALGICTGILSHTMLASFGLSVILSSSAVAFNITKLLGAAYLMFMGIKTLASKKMLLDNSQTLSHESTTKIYFQGVLTNALNPKVALFFLALLPQFVSPDNSYSFLPFLILGLTFFCTSTIWCVLLAFVSSYISRLLQKSSRIQKIANKCTGVIYMLLGLNILAQKM